MMIVESRALCFSVVPLNIPYKVEEGVGKKIKSGSMGKSFFFRGGEAEREKLHKMRRRKVFFV